MAISKPNQIATTGDFDELQATNPGWESAAPATDTNKAVDPYSPSFIGGIGAEHNSSNMSPTEVTYEGFES